MVLGARFRRWRWRLLAAVAVVVLLAIASFFVTLPLREADKENAARDLVAWIVVGRSVPGFGESYPDAKHMPKMQRFFVVCDFLPAGVSVSDDPRVQRITSQEQHEVFEKHRFDDTDYIVILLKSESASELILEFGNSFGVLGGTAIASIFAARFGACGQAAS